MSRLPFLTVALAGLALAGCREIPAPDGGVQALSRVILGSPGLVVGDTLRDSLGNVAPLRIVAFDAGGDTVAVLPAVTFIVFDTTAAVDGDVLVGEHTGRARVIATVAGLQSRIDTVTVTLRPDTIVSDSTRFIRLVDPAADTSFAAPELAVTVQHREGTTVSGVDAVVVRYSLVRSPANAAGGTGPTVVFVGGTSAAARDTTRDGGRAGRAVRLRLAALPQLAGGDSAIVTATASYRGQSLGTVTFTIVFQTQ